MLKIPPLLRRFRWTQRFPLPLELTVLPGWRQRRRVLQLWAAAGALMLLRPLWPVQLLPGWVVGALLLWAIAELVLCCWRPRRWR